MIKSIPDPNDYDDIVSMRTIGLHEAALVSYSQKAMLLQGSYAFILVRVVWASLNKAVEGPTTR